MTSLSRVRSWLMRRLFTAAKWLDRRDPFWLARLSPRTKRRLFGRVWRRLASGLPDLHRLDGLVLRVPSAMIPIYVAQSYEPETKRLLEYLLQPGSTAVDVGANLGYLTAVMARAVGPTGRVWAVEPDPENLRLMRENLSRNGYSDRVEVIAAAAGRRQEVRRLYRQPVGARNTFYSAAGSPEGEVIEVRTVCLDEVIDGPVDLIKIDVEGSEIEALGGLGRHLACEPRPQLIVEWCPQASTRAGYRPGDLPRSLRRLGYGLRLIPECPGPDELDEALAMVDAGALCDGWYGNLYATPLSPRREGCGSDVSHGTRHVT